MDNGIQPIEGNQREVIYITEDTATPAPEFCAPGFLVVSDVYYASDLAPGFPNDRAWVPE
jgi:hypothetical protein